MIYKPENFILQEFVSREVWKERGDRAWELLDYRIVVSVQEIRDYTGGRVVLNDWKWGGNREQQVFRTSDYYDEVRFSPHLFGRAADPKLFLSNSSGGTKLDGEQSRELILSMKRMGKLEFVTAMEDDVDWLHIDCRQTDRGRKEDGLFIFKP